MTARNVSMNHGLYLGGSKGPSTAPNVGAVANHEEKEQWLGRNLPYIRMNQGGGTWSSATGSAWENYDVGSSITWPNMRQLTDVIISTTFLLVAGSSPFRSGDGNNRELVRTKLLETANGVNDGSYNTILNRIAATGHGVTRPMYFSVGHEMDGDWYWHSTMYGNHDEYILAFRHVADLIRAKLPMAKICFECAGNANKITSFTNGLTNFDAAWPGDAYVDVVMTNSYAHNSAAHWTNTEKPRLIWAQQQAVAHNKPFAIGEWGLWIPETGDYDAWMHDMYSVLSSFPDTGPGALLFNCYHWWNTLHRLDQGTTPKSLAIYQEQFDGNFPPVEEPPPVDPCADRVAALQAEISSLEGEVATLESANTDLRAQVITLTTQRGQLEAKISQAIATLQS